jgi:hypothetical protein
MSDGSLKNDVGWENGSSIDKQDSDAVKVVVMRDRETNRDQPRVGRG